MTILGIETSCDETSAAVVRDGRLLSNVTRPQLFHAAYGGVVPELASRAHQQLIIPIVDRALSDAGVTQEELDGVAAVYGPGLIGSILVGLSFGKALAYGRGIPFVGVNHMEAHIVSNFIEPPHPGYPFVNLTVSGGHTQLVLVTAPLKYEVLGETRDDAAGEAFDKVAKLLGLEYPGGPAIDKLARKGDPNAIQFPRPYLDTDSYEFSFSGLKTSVLYYLRDARFDRESASRDEIFVNNVCASFQSAVVDVLVDKLVRAAKTFRVADIAVAGGVSANSALREALAEAAANNGLKLFVPKFEYCTDNGAMVAMAGYLKFVQGTSSSLELTAIPNLALS